MNKLKIAIQKSGRLSEKSLDLLRECGIKIPLANQRLKTVSTNFPLEVLFLRDDDIPQYVEQNLVDVGILGENEVWEQNRKTEIIKKLGFGQCKMSLAIPKDEIYTDLSYFNHKRIATSYPNILKNFCKKEGLSVSIEKISGSVEIAPELGLSQAIFDIVSSGSTLLMNGMKEVEIVTSSEAVLIKSLKLPQETQKILDSLIFRIQAVINSVESKYILLNAPKNKVKEITKLLPGIGSPTILPLVNQDWVSIHSVIKEDEFWNRIDSLKEYGAQGILIIPIEKMIV